MMKQIVLTAAILTTLLIVPCPVQAADIAPRFAVVRLVNYDKSATNLVMSIAEFQALTAEIRAETPIFGRALAAAANEWKQDDAHRSQSFPANAFWTRQTTVVGPVYDSEAKAIAALKPLLLSAASMKPSRQPTKADLDEHLVLADAQDLLVEQLDNLKAASHPGGAATVSTNKIALTAGQLLTREIAGDPTHTTYHIAVPDNFKTEKPPPLLVVFSPGGDGMDMLNHVRASANKVGWMVIGCDNLRNGRSDEEELPIEKALLHDLRTFIPYDPARLYYGGMSGGAMRAYLLTNHVKDRCAGILAFGGWIGGPAKQKLVTQRKMAIAMVNGDGDTGALTWEAPDKAVLESRHCDVKTFHFPGGHEVAPSGVIDEAIAWLDKQARSTSPPTKPPGARSY